MIFAPIVNLSAIICVRMVRTEFVGDDGGLHALDSLHTHSERSPLVSQQLPSPALP